MVKRNIRTYFAHVLLAGLVSLQLAAYRPCCASEESYPLKQEEQGPTGQLFSNETTLYTRDFDGGYITLEVGNTIVFSITVTSGPLFLCPNVLSRIEQNGNQYLITPEGAGEDTITIAWRNLHACGFIDAGQTVTGIMSLFPFSFTIAEPFRLYYSIGSHGEDHFDITPGILSTTTSQAATTSVTTTTVPVTSTVSTTTPPVSLCLAEKIYGEDAEETALLRLVRDELLSQTPEGQALIRLYYQWNTLLAQTIGDDEGIKEELKELIDEILPVFEEMLE